MTDKEAIKILKDDEMYITDSFYREFRTTIADKYTKAFETVLNLVKNQQEKIEYYKKQKDYDDQFKHELLETIRCKSLEIDSLNKVLDDRLIYIQGGRGLYAKLRGLDKEYLIREYLSMYKMRKAEIEKKDKIIDEAIEWIKSLHDSLIAEYGTYETEFSINGDSVQENKIKEHFINKVEKEN